ncbi:MAG: tetratricopeptide repeat protein [Promethearchaeota archaeon]|jgi:tetratricopeptide (TPR) repeat protein
MNYSESEEIIKANRLMQDAKFKEALQLMNKFEEKEGLSHLEKISCYNLKSSIFRRLEKKEEFFKYAKKAFQACQRQEPSLQLIDVYIEMVLVSLSGRIENDETIELLKKCEDLVKILTQVPPVEIAKREAKIAWVKSDIYDIKNEYDRALKYAEQSLVLREKLNLRVDIIDSLSQIKEIYYTRGDLDLAQKYAERCLRNSQELDYKRAILFCYVTLGLIYSSKGEIKQGIEYQKQALAIAEEKNMIYSIAACCNNLGVNYHQQNEFDLAKAHFEKSFEFFNKAGSPGFTVTDCLFHLFLEKGDLVGAKKYLDRLKQLKDKWDNNNIDIAYRIDKAVFLKTSPRALNRGKAEEILKKVIEEDTVWYDMLIVALLNLCDLLLFDLHNTGLLEIVNELNSYIVKLINIAEKNHSFLVLAETYLLQARLALLTLDLKETRLLLTKAQDISERYGLSRLAIKISTEHDAFLKQQNVWENMNKDDVSLAERIELSGINQQMDGMLRKKELEFPKVSDEDPVVILIVSESGELIFSQSFTERWSFEDDMFGSFLSAINSFSDELFSEGLDRANFGQYSVLMKSISPFLVCYLFKGQSYLAQHRIRYFVDSIESDNLIWETINKFYRTSQEIQVKDIPRLEPLITEIFIDKNIPEMN